MNKIIEQLKNNSEIQFNKYNIEIDEINNKNKYYDSIFKNKENKINELSKNINIIKEEGE